MKKILQKIVDTLKNFGKCRFIRYFKKHGILGCFKEILYFIFKVIKMVFIGKKEQIETENKILDEWKKQWEHVESFSKEEDLFYNLFLKTYKYVDKKAVSNCKKNFRWKLAFLIILLVHPVIKIFSVFLFVLLDVTGKNNLLLSGALDIFSTLFGKTDNLVEYAVSLFIWIFFAVVIAKWLDIKKYQETWVRHSDHKQKMEAEMLKFIYGLDIYEEEPVREKFMKEIMRIWDENQKVFSDNMNNKEKPLNDITVSIKNLKESLKGDAVL